MKGSTAALENPFNEMRAIGSKAVVEKHLHSYLFIQVDTTKAITQIQEVSANKSTSVQAQRRPRKETSVAAAPSLTFLVSLSLVSKAAKLILFGLDYITHVARVIGTENKLS